MSDFNIDSVLDSAELAPAMPKRTWSKYSSAQLDRALEILKSGNTMRFASEPKSETRNEIRSLFRTAANRSEEISAGFREDAEAIFVTGLAPTTRAHDPERPRKPRESAELTGEAYDKAVAKWERDLARYLKAKSG